MYAEKGPNSTMKYEYSAPEVGIMVPSLAYARAPEIKKRMINHLKGLLDTFYLFAT